MFAFLSRILLIFFTVSVVRTVVQAVLRVFRGNGAPPQRATPTGATEGAGENASSASTLLHQDPVCGTYVAAASSLRKICNGKVFHFCSDECRNRYNG
jgi:YHS domain-containing protein